jgi:hypothetical protein
MSFGLRRYENPFYSFGQWAPSLPSWLKFLAQAATSVGEAIIMVTPFDQED